jgi:hypothetical protein
VTAVELDRRVNPHRITLALDAPATAEGPFYGPGVDEFCGVTEPAVDEWEAGIRVPTGEQIGRLAELTGYPVGFFYVPDGPPVTGFICQRSGRGKGCRTFSWPPEAPAQGELF